MKYWLPATAILLIATAAQAEDYRVVYSPSMALEVFIDNVESNAPQDWCQENIHLRIVSGKSKESGVLAGFLPRVGTLLQNQCRKLVELPWHMTNDSGSVLATGTATREQSWRPIVITDAAATATANSTDPLALARPANNAPLQHFDLPGGCHFRTWWDENGRSLFIPDGKALTCSTEGWLEGKSELTLSVKGTTQQIPVHFYQGYPLRHVHPTSGELDIVAANNQRLVVSKKDAPDSWLLLTFNPSLHVWSFDGTLLVKMSREEAADGEAQQIRVDAMHKAWNAVVDDRVKMNVLLVDDLHADQADPATGAWRTVNSSIPSRDVTGR